MTIWQRIYLILGGEAYGCENQRRYIRGDEFGPYPPGDQLSWVLKRFGFLKRDPDLPERAQGYWYNFKWQWRFWRGPYRDVIAKLYPDWDPPSWWATAREEWL